MSSYCTYIFIYACVLLRLFLIILFNNILNKHVSISLQSPECSTTPIRLTFAHSKQPHAAFFTCIHSCWTCSWSGTGPRIWRIMVSRPPNIWGWIRPLPWPCWRSEYIQSNYWKLDIRCLTTPPDKTVVCSSWYFSFSVSKFSSVSWLSSLFSSASAASLHVESKQQGQDV